jgi:ubiquitin carboxyl-terminal hydrolase 9/24
LFCLKVETPERSTQPQFPPPTPTPKSANNEVDEFQFTPYDTTTTTTTNIDNLLPVPQEMQIYLFGALSHRYLKELIFAFEQINLVSLSKTLHMVLSCCYCNESFSSSIIQQILLHVSNASSNEIKQALALLHKIVLLEDPLQLTRFKLAIDGGNGDNVYDTNMSHSNGLLACIRQNQSSDAKKSYHCVKFIVTLATRSGPCKEYLLKTANNWEWSINWLKHKMSENSSASSSSSMSYINWNSNSNSSKSNEDTEIKTFQRTKSAQRTLDDATALLRSGDF